MSRDTLSFVRSIERLLERPSPYPKSKSVGSKSGGGHGGAYGVPYLGTFGRPGDGRVGLAYGRPPLSRLKGFPYDRNDPDQAYGQPGNVPDRADGGNRPDHHPGGPVPSDTSHSVWDQLQGVHLKRSGFEEASGTPTNFTMSGRGGMATNIPGGSGMRGWGGAPTHPWDEDDMDSELERYGEASEGVANFPLVVPPETVPDPAEPHWEDTADPELASVLDPEQCFEDDDSPEHELGDDPADAYSDFPSVLVTMPSEPAFANGLGRTMTPGRGFALGWTEEYDIFPAESVWLEALGLSEAPYDDEGQPRKK